MDADRKLLEERIGHAFLDPSLLDTALTHGSYLHESPVPGLQSYERLEFLGDAVLGLAVSHQLMTSHPERSEGELTKARAQLVNEAGLAEVAATIELGGWLKLGRGEEQSGGRKKPSLLADALEAVLGAVFLDGGFLAAEEVSRQLFGERVLGAFSSVDGANFKTRLQERVQARHKLQPRYAVVASEGPDHDKTFEVEVSLGERSLARATGKSKKEAEQKAAERALAALQDEEPAGLP